MSNKIRSLLILILLFIVTVVLGGFYVLAYQPKQIKVKTAELETLNQQFKDVETLISMYDSLKTESDKIDSILYHQAKAIPFRESITDTYNDIISISKNFSKYTRINIEYDRTEQLGAASVDYFTLTGQGDFNDVFRLIYELEKSKKLYKITSLNLTNSTLTTGKGEILYQVQFEIELQSYFTTDKNLALNYEEPAQKKVYYISDYFYPLIQPDIPPNFDGLLELEGASLLAIIPDAVFIMDRNGNAYTLSEGDPVYLGYLTRIDYDNQQCEFLLNRGGIIEKVILKLKSFNTKESRK